MTIQIELVRRLGAGERGYRYDALHLGEVIATSRDPEHAACRALRDLGHTGTVAFTRNGVVSSRVRDLVAAAEYGINDSDRRGLLRLKFLPGAKVVLRPTRRAVAGYSEPAHV